MKLRINALAGVALAASATLALSACGGGSTPAASPSEPGTDAGSDKTVTLYSGRSESLIKPLLEEFTAETGIKVEVRYGDTAQMAAQLVEEGDKSPADVFLGQDAGALGVVGKAGLFSDLPESTVSAVPEDYRDANGQWVGVTGRVRVLIYNKDLVPAAELPATVQELNDAKYAGKVGVAPTNASFQSFVTALRELDGEQAASEYLAGLAGNDPQIREKNGQIVADVNDGKFPFGLVNHYYLYQLAKEKGVDAGDLAAANYIFPDGNIGSLINVAGAGLIKHTADSDGQTLLDFLLSERGQTYFAEKTHEYPMISGAPSPAGLPTLAELKAPGIDLNDLDDLATTVRMITEAGLA
ncbi:iron ABC transporter substrate-binding protein [Pseudarthrobacter sp. J75]|uniref:iron ABC transporter substrate-binding protein n=1 Tax=unclassified Pseudarthrobacter TaxID=2647000 RepID=UPI002E807127|nr:MULTISPECIES: iron ABC transporter substrate-binding protein [unclassified Pseudarthrobacter]MEE2522541.1 iron ABC transporter substrate-binding protein [Pseudarthrobacter sp. J47]MEE2529115.1 iron ABC transporter substrate-binding protein [Pseudarthrobacter sp. J75]